GDLFAWFVRELGGSHEELSAAAEALAPGASGLVALDWNNGNRTVLVDPRLSGLIVGQTLATTAPEIYRTLIEATAFGSRVIVEQIERHSASIEDVVVSGGIAQSGLAMQIYADVLDRPVRLARSAASPTRSIGRVPTRRARTRVSTRCIAGCTTRSRATASSDR